MLRHVTHIPEKFEVRRVDNYSDTVLDSWVMDDPIEIMKLVDVEPGSVDYANGLEFMVESATGITGPAKAGGTICIEPVGRIDLVPTPLEPVIELEHYASGKVTVRLDGTAYHDYGLLDIYAAWMHYTTHMTQYERARARDAVVEELERPIESWGPQGIFRSSYVDWLDAPVDGLVEGATVEPYSAGDARWEVERWAARTTEPEPLRYFVRHDGGPSIETAEGKWYETIDATIAAGKTVMVEDWVAYNSGATRAVRAVVEGDGDDQ